MAKSDVDDFLLPIGVVHDHLAGTFVVIADGCLASNDHPGNRRVPGWKAVGEGIGGAINALRLLDVSLAIEWHAIYRWAAGGEERHHRAAEDRRPTWSLLFAEIAGHPGIA